MRPLKPTSARVPLAPPAPRPATTPTGATAKPQSGWAITRQGGLVSAAAPGVARATVSALGRGELPIEDICDLHGMRAEAARGRLERFIVSRAERGCRALLVICGRGLHSGPEGPVLLDLAIEVLTGAAVGRHVLAFASAPPRQGGEGALAVLLRKPRP